VFETHRASTIVLPATVRTADQSACGYRFRSSAATMLSVGQLCPLYCNSGDFLCILSWLSASIRSILHQKWHPVLITKKR